MLFIHTLVLAGLLDSIDPTMIMTVILMVIVILLLIFGRRILLLINGKNYDDEDEIPLGGDE